MPTRKGLNPGDVGYDGYNLGLFEGAFDDSEMEDGAEDEDSVVSKSQKGLPSFPFHEFFVRDPSSPMVREGDREKDRDVVHHVSFFSGSSSSRDGTGPGPGTGPSADGAGVVDISKPWKKFRGSA